LIESIGGYGEDEKKYKLEVLQGFLTSVWAQFGAHMCS
jgi:hypothetical protein